MIKYYAFFMFFGVFSLSGADGSSCSGSLVPTTSIWSVVPTGPARDVQSVDEMWKRVGAGWTDLQRNRVISAAARKRFERQQIEDELDHVLTDVWEYENQRAKRLFEKELAARRVVQSTVLFAQAQRAREQSQNMFFAQPKPQVAVSGQSVVGVTDSLPKNTEKYLCNVYGCGSNDRVRCHAYHAQVIRYCFTHGIYICEARKMLSRFSGKQGSSAEDFKRRYEQFLLDNKSR